MKIKNAIFLKSCSDVKNFPQYNYNEYAFIGRSNVGKSSLINMLTGRKNLVKVGAKPGVTRTINFFIVNDKISFADLPGFGYAKVSKQMRKYFFDLIMKYINNRENLKLAFLLIDIRRVPDDFERDIITLLSQRKISIAIVATKCDKVSKNQRIKNAEIIARELMIGSDSIFFTSSKNREGRNEITALII